MVIHRVVLHIHRVGAPLIHSKAGPQPILIKVEPHFIHNKVGIPLIHNQVWAPVIHSSLEVLYICSKVGTPHMYNKVGPHLIHNNLGVLHIHNNQAAHLPSTALGIHSSRLVIHHTHRDLLLATQLHHKWVNMLKHHLQGVSMDKSYLQGVIMDKPHSQWLSVVKPHLQGVSTEKLHLKVSLDQLHPQGLPLDNSILLKCPLPTMGRQFPSMVRVEIASAAPQATLGRSSLPPKWSFAWNAVGC